MDKSSLSIGRVKGKSYLELWCPEEVPAAALAAGEVLLLAATWGMPLQMGTLEELQGEHTQYLFGIWNFVFRHIYANCG